MTIKLCHYTVIFTLSAVLAACGGGGGGSSPPVATPSTPPVVTSVPTPTYASATEESAAFALLNTERGRCGFGLVAQNAKLDQAAQAHADWGLTNDLFGHVESTSYPNGYTGAMPKDRATAAGYVSSSHVGEAIAYDPSLSKSGFGEKSVRGLLSAPYHQYELLAPIYKDVGISIREPADAGSSATASHVHANFNFGTTSDYQYLNTTDVVTYPCDGSTGTAYQLRGEDPNPVPGRDLVANPLGQPIMVMVRHGQSLAITSVSMTKVSTNASVTLRAVVNHSNDPNNFFQSVGQHVAYVIPDGPLEATTAYFVTLSGTNNGTPFSRQFTFSTGTGI